MGTLEQIKTTDSTTLCTNVHCLAVDKSLTTNLNMDHFICLCWVTSFYGPTMDHKMQLLRFSRHDSPSICS